MGNGRQSVGAVAVSRLEWPGCDLQIRVTLQKHVTFSLPVRASDSVPVCQPDRRVKACAERFTSLRAAVPNAGALPAHYHLGRLLRRMAIGPNTCARSVLAIPRAHLCERCSANLKNPLLRSVVAGLYQSAGFDAPSVLHERDQIGADGCTRHRSAGSWRWTGTRCLSPK